MHQLISHLEKGMPLSRGEKVIRKLKSDELAEFMEIRDMQIASVKAAYDLRRLHEKVKAKSFLLWDRLTLADERAETAEARGLTLGVRRTPEGEWVLAEAKRDKKAISDLIRSLFGIEDDE
jgi:hypothetical protein